MVDNMNIPKPEFLKLLQRYVVNVGISASSLRNQGAPRVVSAARRFLAQLDLTPLKTLNPSRYTLWLDQTTSALLRQFPDVAQKWGAARKALNILTTQSFLNRDLAVAFDLIRLGDSMETPLDSIVAKGLRQMPGGEKLPRWPGVGDLTQEVSNAYQAFALVVARSNGIPRSCLDILLWRPLTATPLIASD
jgi:hypothetical protein